MVYRFPLYLLLVLSAEGTAATLTGTTDLFSLQQKMKIPELIPVLGIKSASDRSQKSDGRL